MDEKGLFKIIYRRDDEFPLCDYCKKRVAGWLREQIIKGKCYTYFLCSYHKNMKILKFKIVGVEGRGKWIRKQL